MEINSKENSFSFSPSLRSVYEDENVLAIDKPTGINSDDFEKRVHRLDKDTSGILLIAKNDKTLEFLQKQFKERKVKKKYLALAVGNIENSEGTEETLIGRSPKDRKKQKAYLSCGPEAENKGLRKAITYYRVVDRLNGYTLVEVEPQTGRKHQIRVHLAFLGHPVAGDKIYGFKNQPCPKNLKRQFLHASYLKVKLPNNKIIELKSKLPIDLEKALLEIKNY